MQIRCTSWAASSGRRVDGGRGTSEWARVAYYTQIDLIDLIGGLLGGSALALVSRARVCALWRGIAAGYEDLRAAPTRPKIYSMKMLGSSVLPDLEETMNSALPRSTTRSIVLICAGSVLSNM